MNDAKINHIWTMIKMGFCSQAEFTEWLEEAMREAAQKASEEEEFKKYFA